jgi:hypothetical protein
VLGALAEEKTVEASPPVGATGTNATPRVDDGHAKEVEPRPEDAPCPLTLTLRSSK